MAAIDWVNVPLTRALGHWGDRIVLVGRKPADPSRVKPASASADHS
jgi:hypothetical protein